MKAIWKLQDAKSQFSRLVQKALSNGPQFVTKHGADAVVVISVKDYETLTSGKASFKDALLNCPKIDQDFEFSRLKDSPRSIEF